MEQYAIYLRKSRKDVELERYGQGETLTRHKTTLLELAKRQCYNIVKIYEEIVSGESISARPQMQSLLHDVQSGMYDGVLVMELERLARGDTKDQGIVAEAFKFTNTLIITPQKIYDPNNEFDEEYFEFGLFMSRREYMTINRRLQAGRVASVKEGNFIGSIPPFGYDKIKTARKSYSLVPNAQAEYVKLIFDMYTARNYTLGQIADQLNSLNVKPQKSDLWTRESLRSILSNPVYIGKIRWNWRPVKKIYNDGVLSKTRPRQDDTALIVDGNHPAIISTEQFNLAQKIRAENTHNSVNKDKKLVNPLAHLVKCSKCGRTMTLQKNKAGKRLLCNNRYCDMSSAELSTIENAVLEGLQMQLNKIEIAIEENKKQQQNISGSELEIKTIINEIDTLEKQQEKLYDFLERGIYSEDVFIERQKNISERISSLKKYLSELRKIIPAHSISEYQIFSAKIQKILSEYSFSDAEEKNKMLSAVISKIIYYREKSTRFNQNPVAVELVMKF